MIGEQAQKAAEIDFSRDHAELLLSFRAEDFRPAMSSWMRLEPVELETIVARGRDDIESEPEPDVDAEPLEEFETISAADATVPLPEAEEFEEMDLEEFEDALYGED